MKNQPENQTATTVVDRLMIPLAVMAFAGIFGAFGVDMACHAGSGAQMIAALCFVVVAAILWAGAITVIWKGRMP